MEHFAASSFWAKYKELPADIQEAADRQFARLKQNPAHPSRSDNNLEVNLSDPTDLAATPSSPRRLTLIEAGVGFAEIARRAREEGPQRVTIVDLDDVVVLSEADYRALRHERPTGRVLVDLLSNSPLTDIEIDHPSIRGDVRAVDL
ncbi:MAG: hypothetical protein HC834_07250 [Rhodospirillales bacterium]|nr:hypothetical protein [Rhodospirillales bacterium]